MSQSVRNDCVLKGRPFAEKMVYTTGYHCAFRSSAFIAVESEYVGMVVGGESNMARVGNGKDRHPRAIQIEYQKVEKTGPSDQTRETGMRQEGEGQMLRKMAGRIDD